MPRYSNWFLQFLDDGNEENGYTDNIPINCNS